MEIRNQAELTALYKRPQEGIVYDSPELVLMQRMTPLNPGQVMINVRIARQNRFEMRWE